jgi:hypothetical protein
MTGRLHLQLAVQDTPLLAGVRKQAHGAHAVNLPIVFVCNHAN